MNRDQDLELSLRREAGEQVAEEASKLDVEGLIEPHVLPQGGQRLGVGALAEHHLCGVSGDQVDHQEDGDGDAAKRWNQQRQAAQDEALHTSTSGVLSPESVDLSLRQDTCAGRVIAGA